MIRISNICKLQTASFNKFISVIFRCLEEQKYFLFDQNRTLEGSFFSSGVCMDDGLITRHNQTGH